MEARVHGLKVTEAVTNEPVGERGGRVGVCVLELAPGQVLQTCVPRGCDLVLLGVQGRTALADDQALPAGRLVVWPRGVPFTLRSLDASSRLCVLAVPAGAEELLAALARDDVAVETVVALAADGGVELVLP